MILKAIKFKRTEKRKWEPGFSIEANGNINDKIIDKKGNIVEGLVYDIKDCNYDLCIDLDGILKNIAL